MGKIDDLISSSLERGEMSQTQHDEIMLLIQADGEIDPEEQAQLSRIFSAVQSGKLKIVDSEREALEVEKREKAAAAQSAQNKRLGEQQAQAEGISKTIDIALQTGSLTQKTHDSLLRSIHADGEIDEVEKSRTLAPFLGSPLGQRYHYGR